MVDEKDEQDAKGGGESTLTVLVAMGANAGIGVLKLVAAIFTGSAAMYAEAAHSVADTATEVLLLTALKRSDRKPDRQHPFGYGKERFFWALIAAVSIFVSGAVFAAYEGIRTMFGESEEQTLAWIAYAVLGVSFVLEGTSWLQAVRQLRNEARNDETTPLRWLRETDDPTVKTVFFEDSAALIGLLLAFAGVGLHQLTGSAFWDGLASVLIAVLLTVVAYILGGTNKGLLDRPPGRPEDRLRPARRAGRAAGGRAGGRPADDDRSAPTRSCCAPASTSTTPWTRPRWNGPARRSTPTCASASRTSPRSSSSRSRARTRRSARGCSTATGRRARSGCGRGCSAAAERLCPCRGRPVFAAWWLCCGRSAAKPPCCTPRATRMDDEGPAAQCGRALASSSFSVRPPAAGPSGRSGAAAPCAR